VRGANPRCWAATGVSARHAKIATNETMRDEIFI
jgi:hypothetical protein